MALLRRKTTLRGAFWLMVLGMGKNGRRNDFEEDTSAPSGSRMGRYMEIFVVFSYGRCEVGDVSNTSFKDG